MVLLLNPAARTRSKLENSAGAFPALGFNPAPGDLSGVARLSDKYQTVSNNLKSTRDSLDAILKQTGVWEGKAAEAFAEQVDELPDYLDKATDSMAKAASALSQWNSALGEMQRKAEELEREAQRARDKVEQAKNDPAFGLVGQFFCDQRSLEQAQIQLNRAERRLDAATDSFEDIIESAERLAKEHTDRADEIANLLRQAQEIAPDKPGLLSRGLETLGNFVSGAIDGAVDVVSGITETLGIDGFIEEYADVINGISDVLGDISTIVGFVPHPVAQGVSFVLGDYALAGHVLAKSGGADVSRDTLVLDAFGMVSGTGSNLITQVAYEGITGLTDEGIFDEEAADTFIGNGIPRNDRQWAQLPTAIFSPGAAVLAGENMFRGWADSFSGGSGDDGG